MKIKNLFTIIAMAGTLFFGATAQAQTSTNAINEQTFFDSAAQYLTSFNTNYDWTKVTFEASTGYKQVTGSGANSVLNAQYDGWGRFNIGGTFQFQGAGSAVGVAGAQLGYALVQHYDARLDFDLQGGYSWYESKGYVEPGIYISKKLTPNTFSRIGLSLPQYFGGTINRNPSFEMSLGFTY